VYFSRRLNEPLLIPDLDAITTRNHLKIQINTARLCRALGRGKRGFLNTSELAPRNPYFEMGSIKV
ncbi:MAG: hypothetical protein AAB428_01740, partial [Patescibacteria group bacterium]